MHEAAAVISGLHDIIIYDQPQKVLYGEQRTEQEKEIPQYFQPDALVSALLRLTKTYFWH